MPGTSDRPQGPSRIAWAKMNRLARIPARSDQSAPPAPPTPSFDPGTLALTGWVRGDFSASPWAGVASAGISATRSLSEATHPPTPGTALNGHVPAAFDGVNQELTWTALTGDDLFDASAGSVAILYKHVAADLPAAAGGAVSSALADTALMADAGAYWMIAVNATGPKPAMSDDGATYHGGQLTASDGWRLLQMKWDGSSVKFRLDSDTWSTDAVGPLGNLATSIKVGVRFNDDIFAKVNIEEILTSDTVVSDADFDSIKSYVNTRYGLSL